jgi:hypothetical protein
MWLLVVLQKAILHYHTAEHGSPETCSALPGLHNPTPHCQITATGAVSYRLQNRGREKTDLEHIECVSGERAKREPMERKEHGRKQEAAERQVVMPWRVSCFEFTTP